jgi:hypothetical protein
LYIHYCFIIERLDQVKRDNHKLLNKMSDIMQKNYLDNKNHSIQYSKSLNNEHRKRELMRITAENQAILKRIQARQPVYNHLKWENDRKVNEQYCKNICEFQYTLHKPSKKHRTDLQMGRNTDSQESGRHSRQLYNEEEEQNEDIGEGMDAHDEYYASNDIEEDKKNEQDEIIDGLLEEHNMEPLDNTQYKKEDELDFTEDDHLEHDDTTQQPQHTTDTTHHQQEPPKEEIHNTTQHEEPKPVVKTESRPQTGDKTKTPTDHHQEHAHTDSHSSTTTTTPSTHETVTPVQPQQKEQHVEEHNEDNFNFDDDPLDGLDDYGDGDL